MAETALHDHAVTITAEAVARRAENIEAVLASLDDFLGHGIRKHIRGLAIHFPGIEQFLRAERQLTARDCPCNGQAGGLAIPKKVSRIVRVVARLHVHIEAASGAQDEE